MTVLKQQFLLLMTPPSGPKKQFYRLFLQILINVRQISIRPLNGYHRSSGAIYESRNQDLNRNTLYHLQFIFHILSITMDSTYYMWYHVHQITLKNCAHLYSLYTQPFYILQVFVAHKTTEYLYYYFLNYMHILSIN